MRRVACRGWEAPSGNPVQKLRRAGSKRHPGGLFFGYFLLAKHKFAWSEFEQPIGWPEGRKPGMIFVAKVSRLSGRDPTLKPAVASATLIYIPSPRLSPAWRGGSSPLPIGRFIPQKQPYPETQTTHPKPDAHHQSRLCSTPKTTANSRQSRPGSIPAAPVTR